MGTTDIRYKYGQRILHLTVEHSIVPEFSAPVYDILWLTLAAYRTQHVSNVDIFFVQPVSRLPRKCEILQFYSCKTNVS